MRLTLRTMLAYLDDILEPQDAQGLEQKIEESKFASDLVHRIRSSMRRLRLGAPKVDGRGMADDANTVAEYLDNSPTMTPDKVLEFEKVCLESDVHLAEVASAHQILTHVLREPAVFEPAIRDRIYRLGHGDAALAAAAKSETKSEPPVAREVADVAPVATVSRPAPAADDRAALAQVPHLVGRQPKASLPIASLAMTLLLGFVLAVVALRAMGELNSNHPVLRLLVGNTQDTQVVQAPPSPTASTTDSTTNETETQQPAVSSTGTSEKTPAEETKESDTKTVDKQPRPADAPKESVATKNETPASPASEPNRVAKSVAADAVTGTASATKQEETKTDTAVTTPDPGTAAPATSSVAPASSTKATRPSQAPASPPAEPAPPAPVNAGIYLSEEQVVAHWDNAAGAWLLLPANAPLSSGAELLSLPTYRPQVLVSPNVKVTLVGDAHMKLHVPDAMSLPRITLDSGRATLIPVGEMGGKIHVDTGGRSGVLTFDDIESASAIHVRLYSPPGADPLVAPPHLVVQLWASSGSIVWQEQGQPAVNISAGQMASFVDESEVKVTEKANLPDWIDGKDLSEIDRRASIEMRKFLSHERPLSLSLMELTNYRQVEVRSLACRALCHLDIFEPALESFGDEQHRSYWSSHYDALQTRMSQGAEPAAKLKATVDKLFNDQGDLVFRLMRGYSSEQLRSGGAKELVDELINPAMAIRALSQENLRRITGKTQLFRPEYPPDKEKSKVMNWRKMLDDGQIDYKETASAP